MIGQYLTPELTAILITAVLVPLLKQVVTLITTFLESKIDEMQSNIKSERLNRYIDQAEDAVFTAVDSVAQTYANSLKCSGSFDAEAQKKAFELAKTKALSMIGEAAKSTLKDNFGDLEVWIENKIETNVKNSKSLECGSSPNIVPNKEVINKDEG